MIKFLHSRKRSTHSRLRSRNFKKNTTTQLQKRKQSGKLPKKQSERLAKPSKKLPSRMPRNSKRRPPTKLGTMPPQQTILIKQLRKRSLSKQTPAVLEIGSASSRD